MRTTWNIEELTGYKPQTTFWSDFDIADHFGLEAIQQTYDVSFTSWKHDHIYITELCMVLNHKIWYWYEKKDYHKACLYDRLWKQCDAWCMNNLKGEELEYYLRVTD